MLVFPAGSNDAAAVAVQSNSSLSKVAMRPLLNPSTLQEGNFIDQARYHIEDVHLNDLGLHTTIVPNIA
eukprot:6490620-Amphidinium_carterae.9